MYESKLMAKDSGSAISSQLIETNRPLTTTESKSSKAQGHLMDDDTGIAHCSDIICEILWHGWSHNYLSMIIEDAETPNTRGQKFSQCGRQACLLKHPHEAVIYMKIQCMLIWQFYKMKCQSMISMPKALSKREDIGQITLYQTGGKSFMKLIVYPSEVRNVLTRETIVCPNLIP
jgi:hypothetical protein